MSPSVNGKKRGIIYTFYSYKGGVGRTMALANVAALLAKWGNSVLIVDWDLKAPGLERFFARRNRGIRKDRETKPGILDLIQARRAGEQMNWRDWLLRVDVDGNSAQLSMLTAGRNDTDYTSRLQSLDFAELFERYELGSYIERIRNEWTSEFDFVLVDSRTGVTDIGGICTVHLADVLVLLFTSTESSLEGALEILERARRAQQTLPVDRKRLLAVPVPARDESRTEYERAAHWKKRFAERFGPVYRDWLPSGITAHEAIDLLRIPYVPYWSFGEELPVLDEGTTDPASLGYAFETLARILLKRLDWYAALEGQLLISRPAPIRRQLDQSWLDRHRKGAREKLRQCGRSAFMEVFHFSPDSTIEKPQPDLLQAARQAQVQTGWPIGIVREPVPTDEGIQVTTCEPNPSFPGNDFAYWSLRKNGDFYTLISLDEDNMGAPNAIYIATRMLRAAETLLHCSRLSKALGIDPNAHMELTVHYSGVRGRTLEGALPFLFQVTPLPMNLHENDVVIHGVTLRLAAIESDIVGLVKKLCEPLFVVFEFSSFSDDLYLRTVADFLRGKVMA
jgi:MinD-like ATPase involved in chromosome partitioning or flagellar assembly